MTILVTGATGTIGGAVVPRLVEAGQKVRALTRDASRAEGLHPSAEIAEGDLGDPEGMRRALHGVDRVGQAEALRRNGADIVVTDLAELLAKT